jgi:hypothetical protein
MAKRAKQFVLSLLGILALSGATHFAIGNAAMAQEDMSMQSPSQASGIGVGVESLLSGPSGPTVVYQAENWHAEGILGVFDRANTTVLLAGRYYYQIHSGDLSDFSVGGGLGVLNTDTPGMGGGDETDIHVELGAKIRVFMAPNVALSSSLGLAIIADDANDTAIIAGRLQGTMGITYFFF